MPEGVRGQGPAVRHPAFCPFELWANRRNETLMPGELFRYISKHKTTDFKCGADVALACVHSFVSSSV